MVPGRHWGGWCGLGVTYTGSSGHGWAGSIHGWLKADDAVLDARRARGWLASPVLSSVT